MGVCRIEGADVFGLLRPCAHSAAKYGIGAGEFFTQMCGLCLGLRDEHSQTARAATNTDAIVLNVLTEAQRPEAAAREVAGACPLRGMRRATVAGASAPGVRLAATASLLLGAAKIRDHVDDGEVGVLRARPMARVAAGWFARARVGARDIGLDIEPLIAAIDAQAGVERAVAAAQPDSATDGSAVRRRFGRGRRIGRGDSSTATAQLETLAELTRATQLCTAELFAHTAILAGCPENVAALREAGWHFGRIAHLADAIEDREQDRSSGKFNPLTATGTTPRQAYALLRESNSQIEAALWRAGLSTTPTVRWALLDPVTSVVRRMRRTAHTCGAAHACHCGTTHRHNTIPASADPEHTVQLLGFPAAPGLIDLTASDSTERTSKVSSAPTLLEIVATPSLVRLATALSPLEAHSNQPGPNDPYRPDPYRQTPYPSGPGGSNPYGPQPGTNPQPRPGATPYGPGTPNPYGTNPTGPGPHGPQPGANPYNPGPGTPNHPGPQTPYGPGPGPNPQIPHGRQPGMPPNNPVPYDIPAPFSNRPNNTPRYDHNSPPPPPPERPGCGTGLAIICGAYCTGYACCATHRRPCTGVEQGPWIRRGDCWCDCCDGCCESCSCCSDCNDCGCCDGCCCDC